MHGTVSLRSVHGKFLSAQPDGRAEWNRDEAHDWEHFHVEKRHNGKITLKGVHGMYLSAQPDGSVQINRREAPEGGWEEFTVEDRGSDVVCLKSSHGKYLSAQQNGTAQWNRDHAPPGGWEDIQIEYQGSNSEIHDEEAIRLFKKTLDDHGVPSDFTSRSPKRESIEILEAVPGKPVRFKINNPPSSNDAWVGIYHPSSSDQEIGKQKQQWEWLRDLDVNNASLPEQSEGNWSIRVFSDGGYRLHERKDFAVEPKREAFSLPTESSSPTYIGKPWHKLTKEEKAVYPVPEGSLSLPIMASFLFGIPWFLFAYFVWALDFLNTIWIGKCAYCPDAQFQNGEIWWGLLTPIANFGAVLPFLLVFLFLWWSIFPTPEWRRNEMAGWLLMGLPMATFWFMLALISFDLLTWVEGSLGISDNYDMGSRELYWTFSWIAIPAVGWVALAPTYYCLQAIFFGTHSSPPPPFAGELGSRVLHEGDRGKDVSRLQELLNKMSNSNLAVDGHFGTQTKAALMEFETNNSLDPDGVLDSLALALLDKSEPNTNEELVELIDLIISVIDPKDKGKSRDQAELIFANLLETMPFNMRSSARQIWEEKFGINRDVLQWWK